MTQDAYRESTEEIDCFIYAAGEHLREALEHRAANRIAEAEQSDRDVFEAMAFAISEAEHEGLYLEPEYVSDLLDVPLDVAEAMVEIGEQFLQRNREARYG